MMPREPEKGVPALQNEDVTGMTEPKQDEIVRESGTTSRDDAAKDFYDTAAEEANASGPSEEPSRADLASEDPRDLPKDAPPPAPGGETNTEFGERWGEGGKAIEERD
jgi:hypothetical protein